MSFSTRIAWDDTVLPFQLDKADIRGRLARIDTVLDDILGKHRYPAPVAVLLAEAVLLTALIGQTMELRWKFSLQVRGRGAIRLIATDYFSPAKEGESARIRGYAGYDVDAIDADASPFEQLGEGYFAITVDQGPGTLPYQGITPIAGGSLAACAEHYFEQSEQLPTRFALSFGTTTLPGDGVRRWRAGGVVLQHLPKSSRDRRESLPRGTNLLTEADRENWNRANILLDTVQGVELVGPALQPTEVLVRLFHEEGPRVFDAQSVSFGCTCSEARVRGSLAAFSDSEIAEMTTEDGLVTADCQFCGAHYELDPSTLGGGAKKPRDIA